MVARHTIDGKYCCECDYCALSTCDKTPANTIMFSDNYYISFCNAHEEKALKEKQNYLNSHLGVNEEIEG